MPMQMPGYQAHQDKLNAAQKALEAKRVAEAKKQADDVAKKKQETLEARVQNKKLRIAKKITNKNNPIFKRFLKNFFIGQTALFLLGSIMFFIGPERNDELYDDWQRTSYWDAFKIAYGMNGKINKYNDPARVWYTLFFSAVILCISIIIPKKENSEIAQQRLAQLEELKRYGINVEDLIRDLTPACKKMLESLSKVDRGYFDNLAAGGLDKADYETCVAIISGYLKSHPKEYNKIIEIIDEATLPDDIKKKYGPGKTISFAAAQAIVPER